MRFCPRERTFTWISGVDKGKQRRLRSFCQAPASQAVH
ncbi:hypothetical protein GAGA_0409 [Paraglaciecola agarilytica NO2]|uniref:Uncharacterized protein n=1 Tax=Paraglaciecola agarilytica NO2 TaxID=1125747 RepID=A0ABQ0I1R8_9ALTE|nr:hypothetical protein GAGA_0409 [Paraglaciecola agarilytica NO2]